jgi:elongation factor Ts
VTVSVSLVKELRDQTGAGMMDCKRALDDAGGDLEAAKRLLRERGLAAAGKRAGRTTPEGLVGYRIADGVGTLVAVGCETEPVAGNAEFQSFARRVLEAVERDGPDAATALEDERTALVARIGENVQVVGAARFEAGDGETLAAYVHPPVNKVGAMVKAQGGTPELAREVAMHLSFARPRFVSREQVPPEEVEQERETLSRQEDVVSKSEHVRERIVDGRLQKWYADLVLLDQPWYRGTGSTVAEEVGDMEIRDFAVYALGR